MEIKTLHAAAVEKLRQAIFEVKYAPGERLKQKELACLFGYSVIPVREALHQLAAEGLIVIDPQKGAHVADLSSRRIQEIFDLRIRLDLWAVSLIVGRLTPKATARIAAVLDKMERPDITEPEWFALDLEFHDTFYACAEHEILLKMIHGLRVSAEPYLRLDLAKVGGYDPIRREHRKIFQACVRGDRKAAERYTRGHLSRVAKGLVGYLRQQGR